jgi:hypothetical protein
MGFFEAYRFKKIFLSSTALCYVPVKEYGGQ